MVISGDDVQYTADAEVTRGVTNSYLIVPPALPEGSTQDALLLHNLRVAHTMGLYNFIFFTDK